MAENSDKNSHGRSAGAPYPARARSAAFPPWAIERRSQRGVEIHIVDPAALSDINQDVLQATLRGFAKHGFSGDLEFRYESRQILRTVCEIYVEGSAESPQEALESIERNWPFLKGWTEQSGTLLQVLFQRGKITRVRRRDV